MANNKLTSVDLQNAIMTDEKAELLKRIETLARNLTEEALNLAIGFISN